MKSLVLALLLVAPVAADQTFTGQISDSLCKAKHEEAAEDQGKMSDHDCTVACVKGGSKYVLLGADGKVYDIANQDFKDLEKNAGAHVKITGELKGTAISVSKIDPQ
ncbi:MAG TPA: hypothetical protein VFA27_02360 [Vicinamibacterales bacterium]|nr:hypothetical protein [Vicinamibacterales bacterium]